MPENIFIQIPFVLDFSNFQFDKAVIFFVTTLLAITVNAEGQAFMATLLGDSPKDPKDRFHFNPLRHINPAGLISFAVAGFGWPNQIKVNTEKFKHPGIYCMIIKFAGAFANIFLAGIAASILWIYTYFDVPDQVFPIVVAVNVMVFVFNIIPLPPLAGASILSLLVPEKIKKTSMASYFSQVFPYVLVSFFILMRINDWTLFNQYLYPVVRNIFRFMLN